jgi:hypothetical protein
MVLRLYAVLKFLVLSLITIIAAPENFVSAAKSISLVCRRAKSKYPSITEKERFQMSNFNPKKAFTSNSDISRAVLLDLSKEEFFTSSYRKALELVAVRK